MTTTVTEEAHSPFAGFAAEGPAEAGRTQAQETGAAGQESWTAPFTGFAGLGGGADEAEEAAAAAEAEFLESLHDEDFVDAVDRLVDEAAARHAAEQGSWSGRLGEHEAFAALEAWIEPLARESETALERLADQLEATHVDSLADEQQETVLEGWTDVPSLGSEAFDQFLGGLLRKARRFAGRALKTVGKVVGKILPVGALLKKLAGLVKPLLRKVLTSAIGRLPAAVRPLARGLAAKLGLAEAEALDAGTGAGALAEAFDSEVAALLAPDGGAAEDAVQHEGPGQLGADQEDPVAALDAGRARLAEQLAALPPGATGEPEIAQFVPLVLAVRPLVKLAMGLIGRQRIVDFLGRGVAALIGPLITKRAATVLSPLLVDVGLRAFGFEHGGPQPLAGESGEQLSGEALAATVEGALGRTLDALPAEALADEVQLGAALQEAFAEAAAAYLPDRMLAPELPERETAGEGGVWVLMPRRSRPHRYRKYTRVFLVPVSRQTARAVRWGDGTTLETRLLDGGARSWPVQTEVHLYEAVPGTQFGHLTQDESLAEQEQPDAGEFEPLTPETAGLLLGEPGLGRAHPGTHRGRPRAGLRYVRIRPVDGVGPVRRTRRRVLVGLDLPRGQLRVSVRLSERQAQQVLTRLHPAAQGAPRDLAGVLAAVRRVYAPVLGPVLAQRLLRRGLVPDAALAAAAGRRVSASVGTALSSFLAERSSALSGAAQDPAAGVTLAVTFTGVTRSSLTTAAPLRGQVTVVPGWGHRG